VKATIAGRLEAIICDNGFSINYNKVRLQTRNERQEVTGLTVNNRPNVDRAYKRRVRAMLHAWERHGLTNAEAEYHSRYRDKYRSPFKPPPQFIHVLRGKIEFIGMVRGKADHTYTMFLTKYYALLAASTI
jgi:RNA-directed DNA polymerase